MSYTRIIKAQNGLQLVTETGNMDLNPAGSLSLKGHVIGTDVQAHSARLAEIAGLSPASGEHLEWNGSAWVAATHSEEATTAAAPLTLAAGEVGISLDAGNLEVNGSNELAIKAGGVGSTEVADDAVDSQHIAAGALDNEHYADGSITTAKLNASVLTNPSFGLSSTMTSSNANASSSAHAFYASTSDATPLAVTLGSLTDDEVYLFDCYVAARDQTSGDAACYKAQFAASAASGSASIHGATNVEVVYEAAGASAWAVDFDNDGSDGIECNVTGDASNAVHWNVTVTRVRVA